MAATNALTGSCACGAVRFTSTTLPSSLTFCDCQRCRKVSGAPFLPWAALPNASLHWHSPSPVKITPSPAKISGTPIAYRGSCSECGSPLFMKYNCWPEVTDIPMGIVDDSIVDDSIMDDSIVDDSSVKRDMPRLPKEVFLEEKAEWWELGERCGAARYESGPEAFGKDLERWAEKGALPREDVSST